MTMSRMIVTLAGADTLDLVFEIENTALASLWLERMSLRHQWPMDNPDRFYGFNDIQSERERAIEMMTHSINTINAYRPIIDRYLHDIADQDTLNYLHNIFEKYHGGLDEQDHEFWNEAPDSVKKALADLNIHVHRCESLRGNKLRPRMVCTWYGMPKTLTLSHTTKQQFGSSGSVFGGVYLNYAEIGKTAQDMANDDDHYMADEMFRPFEHYTADFRVDFYDETDQEIKDQYHKTSDYFARHKDFFAKFGITCADDVRIRPIKFKVAQLQLESRDKDYIISQIRKHQRVSSVILQ